MPGRSDRQSAVSGKAPAKQKKTPSLPAYQNDSSVLRGYPEITSIDNERMAFDHPGLPIDRRLSPVQRQAAALQLERAGGNRYLLNLMNQPGDRPLGGNNHHSQQQPYEEKQTSPTAQPDENLALAIQPEGKNAKTTDGSRSGILVPQYQVQKLPRSEIVAQLNNKLPTMQATARAADTAFNLAQSYINLSVATTDLLSTKLQLFSLNYQQAYNNYSRVIGAGRAEAQNQTLWRGIFLGIATGVLAGVAAAYIAPSTAAAWFTLTAADALTAAGSSCLQAIASGAIAYALSDAMTARGSDLQPGGLSPDVLRTNIWQHMAQMYRGAFQMTGVMSNFHRYSIIHERLIAEMRVHIAGGTSAYSGEDVVRAANTMFGRVNGFIQVVDGLINKSAALRQFSTSVSTFNPNQKTVDQIEKDIWIMWMGTLSDDDSDILDLDAIEDHLHRIGVLGRNSMLGVDFGRYTSKDDELAALRAARRHSGDITRQYETAASQFTAPTP
ncbi:MAG TPA: hypothetical protein VIO61_16295 [Anaerolineaceae bacterium]